MGGAELVAYQIANEFSRLQHDVFVITLYSENDIIAENDVKIYRLKYLNSNFFAHDRSIFIIKRFLFRIFDIFNPFYLIKYYSIFKKEKPDIIHCHNIEGLSLSVWVAAKLLKIPVIQHLHDYYFSCRHSDLMKKGINCQKQSFFCILRSVILFYFIKHCVKTFISPSSFCYKSQVNFNKNFRKIPCKIIKNGTPLTEILLKKKSFKEGILKVCFIGALTYHKGVDLLISIIKMCIEKKLSIEFNIAGKGIMKEEIENLCKVSSNVNYVGFLDMNAKIDLYKKMHLMIFPSIWQENNPMVIIESYAMGLPVLGSNTGGVPEIIPEKWLFKNNDQTDLFKKLIEVYNNRTHLEEESKRLIMERDSHSIRCQMESTYNIYKEFIK